MSRSHEEEQRYRAFGMFASGMTNREVATELDEPYSKINKLKKEYKEAEERGELFELIKADELTIARVAEEVRQDLLTLDPNADAEIISGEIEQGIAKINSLQLLSEKANVTAISVIERIEEEVKNKNLEVKDLMLLAEALAKIYGSFFSKGNQIAILNNVGGQPSETDVSVFKSLQRR